jgi:large subunit ribosomal protein L32
MAVPKKRQSHARTAKRRSHHAVKPMQLQHCPQCQEAIPSHVVCPRCGNYMGRTLMTPGE